MEWTPLEKWTLLLGEDGIADVQDREGGGQTEQLVTAVERRTGRQLSASEERATQASLGPTPQMGEEPA